MGIGLYMLFLRSVAACLAKKPSTTCRSYSNRLPSWSPGVFGLVMYKIFEGGRVNCVGVISPPEEQGLFASSSVNKSLTCITLHSFRIIH